jgi:hypothetical protein
VVQSLESAKSFGSYLVFLLYLSQRRFQFSSLLSISYLDGILFISEGRTNKSSRLLELFAFSGEMMRRPQAFVLDSSL